MAGEEEPATGDTALRQAQRVLAELFAAAPRFGRIAVAIEFRDGRACLVDQEVTQTMRPA